MCKTEYIRFKERLQFRRDTGVGGRESIAQTVDIDFG